MAVRNPRVFLDVAVGRRAVGRLRFELFNDVLPITSENFRCLCTGETGLGYWLRPRWYKHTKMHRIIPGLMVQGGDFNYGNGYMGESIYAQSFRDEKFAYKHSKRGVLSMANNGQRHTNNSQFFVTFAPAPWLDGQHVVFGHMIDGFEVLDKIEAEGCEGGQPKRKVWVHNCGEEDRMLLRQQALEVSAMSPEERLAAAHAAMEGAAAAEEVPVERPEPLSYINEISPVPDEIWRRAKAKRDNML
eukprot:TRINITY_DN40144_c0_g1_i1.p2 TRINITY_DN40144_c0_g1~~TRINITY_DN40144_c0_g1_i1.p2  ORF type:complete len:245 (+),score=69.84 TRINITY_DN40144_c0_g1_i1:99-833(+)